MKRYIIVKSERQRAADMYELRDTPMLEDLTVYEPRDEPVDSGLLDRHGNRLMAVVEREPIGFVRLRER